MTHPSEASPLATTAASHILHVDDGLQRLMGDRKLYFQILRRFRDRYQDVAALLRAECDAGALEDAQRRVHTLKGAAGMIGAEQVYQLALALEAVPAGQPAQWRLPLGQLALALRSVMGMIDSILNDTGADAVDARRANPPDTAMLLQHLARLLEDGDGAAIDVLEQSASVLADSLGVTVFQEVTAAAHQFEFEAARQALAPAL
jgi:two-component system sensor histidine kinase/response regulator